MEKDTLFKIGAGAGAVGFTLGAMAVEAPNAYPWSDTATAESHCIYVEGTSQAQFELNYQNDEPWNSGKDIAVELSVDGKVVDHIEDAKPVGKGTDGSMPSEAYLQANKTKPVDAVYSSAPVGLKKLVLRRTWVNPKFGTSPDTETVDIPAVEKDCKPETPPPTKPPVTTPPATNPPVVEHPRPIDNGGVPPTPAVNIGTAISETAPTTPRTTVSEKPNLPNTGPKNLPEEIGLGLATVAVGAAIVMEHRAHKRAATVPAKVNSHRFGRH